MRFFGGFLVVLGLLSIVLPYVDMNFMFLHWVNNWGPAVSWMIRGGMVLLGLIMYIAGKPTDRE